MHDGRITGQPGTSTGSDTTAGTRPRKPLTQHRE
jgi:hypothetical protein